MNQILPVRSYVFQNFYRYCVINCQPTANAGQYATLHYKPLLLWFPHKCII